MTKLSVISWCFLILYPCSSFSQNYLCTLYLNQDPNKIYTFHLLVISPKSPLSLLSLPPFSFIFSSCHYLLQKPHQLSYRIFLILDWSPSFLEILTCFPILHVSCKMEVSSKGWVKFRFNSFEKLEMLHRWYCVHHITSHQEVLNMCVSNS